MPEKANKSGQQPYDPKNGEYLPKVGETSKEHPGSNEYIEKVKKVKEYASQGGYSGYSMSNRAKEAYRMGEMPLSKWTKETIVNALASMVEDNEIFLNEKTMSEIRKMPVSEMKILLLKKSSWHHTSAKYNKTNFYDIDIDYIEKNYEEAKDYRQSKEKIDREKYQKDRTVKAEKQKQLTDKYADLINSAKSHKLEWGFVEDGDRLYIREPFDRQKHIIQQQPYLYIQSDNPNFMNEVSNHIEKLSMRDKIQKIKGAS